MAGKSDGVPAARHVDSKRSRQELEAEGEGEEDHLGRVLRGCFEAGAFERDGGRHHHHACETFRARDDMDDLLRVFRPPQGLDICEIMQHTVTHAYRSIAALDGAETGGLDARPDRPPVSPKRPLSSLPFQLLQMLLESQATPADVCRQLQCRPSLAVDSWACGNIGASLVILRRCEEALRSLLESSVKFLLSRHDEEGDGGLAGALDSSDNCQCLISCCQRAPDLARRIKLSMVQWVRESKSASLWRCYELICDEIRGGDEKEAADALVLQYQSRCHDFVARRQLFLRNSGTSTGGDDGEASAALSHACAALKALLPGDRGDGSGGDAQLTSVLMESKTFMERLMQHAFCSKRVVEDSRQPSSQEAEAGWKRACERVVPYLLEWIEPDSDSPAFLSSWGRAFAAEGGGGGNPLLMQRFSKALLSQELYA